ncbi:hypothetical protein H920_01016 [Fukomys damarensis]|uniref:Uncharacterized protein n=1 Tax=Fukomys damarensis TaxID=885580 RepID=A0A091EPC0_FUKDA|nr:hypothetical protein H920_01016 [Fukomys damarensis]
MSDPRQTGPPVEADRKVVALSCSTEKFLRTHSLLEGICSEQSVESASLFSIVMVPSRAEPFMDPEASLHCVTSVKYE